MNNSDKNYETKIMKMVVNDYLNKNTSFTKDSLNFLENNREQIVWDLAKLIFSQSGHKIELNLVKNLINIRIESIKSHLEREKNQLINQQIQTNILLTKEKQEPSNGLKISVNIDQIVKKIIEIICDHLDVEVEKVTMQSHLVGDLSIDDWYDFTELIMAMEEEFEIEISDEEAETRLNMSYNDSKHHGKYSSHSLQSHEKSYKGSLGGLFRSWLTEDSFKMPQINGESDCTVENLVNLVLEKIDVPNDNERD